MCFEVCGINRDSLIVRGLFGRSHHDPSEHAHITPVDRQHMRSMCERGRFQRLHSVFGGPTRQVHHTSVDGAPPVHALIRPLDVSSGQRPETSCTPLRLMNIIPRSTRRSSTPARPQLFGNYGRSRCICASVSQYKLRMISSNNWGI
jgi:hypothetical protein